MHAGYLKAVSKEQDGIQIRYNLKIPNLEVETIYQSMLKIDIAKAMLMKNLDVKTIAELTGLSIGELESL